MAHLITINRGFGARFAYPSHVKPVRAVAARATFGLTDAAVEGLKKNFASMDKDSSVRICGHRI